MKEKVEGSPTKDFFVTMLTKDILLKDCIFDLLDNSIDGAIRAARAKSATPIAAKDVVFNGYEVSIKLAGDGFEIKDNCSGISVDQAKRYAFHFGRHSDAPLDDVIGIYGIGMKRAILKMGKEARITSSTATEAFEVEINVDRWLQAESWDFELEQKAHAASTGTTINVTQLYPGIQQQFEDNPFLDDVFPSIARDYSFFLQKGLKVVLNGKEVRPYLFRLNVSDEVVPYKQTFVEDGVTYEIMAGLAGPLLDDTSPDVLKSSKVEWSGWFVACNDRLVLVGDKTDHTVWGDDDFQMWHPQYNGFMGIALFYCDNPAKLPWITTKRDVDLTNAVYRRAVHKMKEATKPFIAYTNQRKGEVAEAKAKEEEAQPKVLSGLPASPAMKLPTVVPTAKEEMTSIQYTKAERDIRAVAKALGNKRLSARQVGSMTFDHYLENEVG